MPQNPSAPPVSPTHLDDFVRYALECGTDPAVAALAADRMAEDRPVLLAVSGKLVAGKDTIPPAVFAHLDRPGFRHLYFASALKDDLDAMIADVRALGVDGATSAIAASDIPHDQARHLAVLLSAELDADGAVTGRTRTPGIRAALQFYGTQVRRAQDSDYWVKRALEPAVEAVASGVDVYFSDCRFPNEVVGARRLGFFTVRLEISPDVQRDRLLARDGLEPDPVALAHESECALDGFGGFDLVWDNDGTVDEAVAATVAGLRAAGHVA
jgi:hypothetical protein